MWDIIQDFFGANSKIEALYWLIASTSSGFLGVCVVLGLFGLDFDHDFDVDLDFGGVDFGDISFSAIAALFSIGGWAGVLAYQMTDLSVWGIFGAASAAGAMGFVATAMLLKQIKKLEETGNLDLENAVGQLGEVYLSIPENGQGQVQIVLQGRLIILDAKTDGKAIETGQKIIVYSLENGKLVVEPYQDLLE